MAKKETSSSKVVLERTYNVPLRKGFQKAPMYRRAKKAVNTLKEFLVKHMKSEDVRLGKYLNQEMWKNGIRNPPHHVKVVAKKNDSGRVDVELEGADAMIKKAADKKAAKAAKKAPKKGKDAKADKPKAVPAAKKSEEKKADDKPAKEAPAPEAKK